MNDLDAAFVFLRPWWLLGIPAGLLMGWLIWHVRDARNAWRGLIDEPLLDALLIRAERHRRLVPANLVGAVIALAAFALAGPSWSVQPSPFAEERAALVVVMQAGETMAFEDVAPTRMDRAAQKVGDLLERKPDLDAGLIAYAGSAHVAMPVTSGAGLVAEFARSITPGVMPRPGDETADAIALANDTLRRAGRSGSILLVAGDATAGQADEIARAGSVPIHVLAISTQRVSSELESIARASGGSSTGVTADASDVDRIAARVESVIGRVRGTDEGDQRRDDGYWLVPLVALGTLAWARRGWSVRYTALASEVAPSAGSAP